jgi:cytochrome P450
MTLEVPAVPKHVRSSLVFDVEVGGANAEAMAQSPYDVWNGLKDLPPVFWARSAGTIRPGGCWVATSADAIREIMQDPETFSNDRGRDAFAAPDGIGGLIPLYMDPPDHGKYRALLAPVFSPKSIDSVERSLYDLSAELIDAFAGKGECDFMEAYARPFPVIVFMRMMGLPMEDRERFVEWEHQIFQGETSEVRGHAGATVAAYMRALLAEKRKRPTDDIMSALVNSKIDGKPIDPQMAEGMCMLLYMAGLDTVAAGLGHTFRFLAEHPEMQARLRANPALIPDAVEESLRYHTWVPTGRLCVRETEFHGAKMMPGDWVQTVLYRASNDPHETDHPQDFLVPREPNRHFAFGAGVHRCAGSHLARREMRIGVRMMLERTGEIRLKPGARLRYDGGFVCLGALPLEWQLKA